MHQAAVKLTKTGRPWACSAATRSGVQAWMSSACACGGDVGHRALEHEPAGAERNEHRQRRGTGACDRGRARRRASQTTKPAASTATSAASTPSGPACTEATQISQIAVANIGKAKACFSTSIQRPGLGSRRSRPGAKDRATTGSAKPSASAANTDRPESRRLRHRIAHRRAHERGGAGRRDDDGERAGHEGAEPPAPAGEAAGRRPRPRCRSRRRRAG